MPLAINQLIGFGVLINPFILTPPAGVLDGFSPTGAWSFSRNLLSSFASARYASTSSRITSLNDQSGNARNLTDGGISANRPLETTGGPNSRACGRFDGTSKALTGAAVSNFLGAGAKFMIFSALVNSAPTLNNANVYSNHHMFGDGANKFAGIFAKNVGGTTPTFLPYNWDGNADTTSGSTFSVGTPYVVTLRHDSGTLYLGVNGGTETSVASGDTTTMTNAFGFGDPGFSTTIDMSVFEGAAFSTVPSSGDRTTIINDFKNWIGA